MPLYITDNGTAQLVADLAERRGITKQDAVKQAVQSELRRLKDAVQLRERFAAIRDAHDRPRSTAHAADKALFDEISGESMTIFDDASAFIAIVAGEEAADRLADTLQDDPTRLCSAIAIWETTAGLCRSYRYTVQAATAFDAAI